MIKQQQLDAVAPGALELRHRPVRDQRVLALAGVNRVVGHFERGQQAHVTPECALPDARANAVSGIDQDCGDVRSQMLDDGQLERAEVRLRERLGNVLLQAVLQVVPVIDRQDREVPALRAGARQMAVFAWGGHGHTPLFERGRY